jgi:hypothetical protein
MLGTPTPQKLKDLGYIADTENPYVPTLTASVTTTLTEWKPLIALRLQASGASVLKLPHWSLWAGKRMTVYVSVDGGGECQVIDAAASDVLGDNLGALTDYCILENIDGKSVQVIKETTN